MKQKEVQSKDSQIPSTQEKGKIKAGIFSRNSRNEKFNSFLFVKEAPKLGFFSRLVNSQGKKNLAPYQKVLQSSPSQPVLN